MVPGDFSPGGGLEQMSNSRPLDGGDSDPAPDDRWQVSLVNVPAGGFGGIVYAICGS